PALSLEIRVGATAAACSTAAFSLSPAALSRVIRRRWPAAALPILMVRMDHTRAITRSPTTARSQGIRQNSTQMSFTINKTHSINSVARPRNDKAKDVDERRRDNRRAGSQTASANVTIFVRNSLY